LYWLNYSLKKLQIISKKSPKLRNDASPDALRCSRRLQRQGPCGLHGEEPPEELIHVPVVPGRGFDEPATPPRGWFLSLLRGHLPGSWLVHEVRFVAHQVDRDVAQRASLLQHLCVDEVDFFKWFPACNW